MSLGSGTQSGFDSSADSSVGVNTLQAEPLESQGLVPGRSRDFSLLCSMQNDYEDYLPSYPKGTSNSYPEGKQLGKKLQSHFYAVAWLKFKTCEVIHPLCHTS
jgi:hypothetical protein